MLQNDLGAIAQRQLLVVELLAGNLLDNLASLRHLGDEGLVLHVVHVGFNLCGTSVGNGLFETLHSRIYGAFLLLVHVHHHEVRVIGRQHLLHQGVDILQRNHGRHLLHHLVVHVDRRDGLLVQEVLGIILTELVVVTLVLIRVRLLQTTQVVLLVALILGGSEAELSGTATLYHQRLQGCFCLAFLRQGVEVESVLGLREQIAAIGGRALHERAVGLLGQFRQTVVEHTNDSILHEVDDKVCHVTLDILGNGVALDHHIHNAILHFLVLVYHIDRLGIVGHGLGNDGSGILGHLDGREERLDLLLHFVDVEVADDDDGLVVGTVPLLIVVAQHFRLEVVDNLHQTDRHTMTVLRTRIQLRQIAFQHTGHGRCAQAPLLVDNATFLINLCRLQQQTVGPVVQDEQTGVNNALAGRRHVRDVIHRTVDSSVGVQVATELHTNRLAPLHNIVTLEVLRTVEAHMLQEVSQTTLVVILLNRTHALGDVKLCALFGPCIVANVIRQTVVQLANAHVGVCGNRLLSHHSS